MRGNVVTHPVVACGREVQAIVPVLLAVGGSEGVVRNCGVEVEDVAPPMLVNYIIWWTTGLRRGGTKKGKKSWGLQIRRFMGEDAIVYFLALVGCPCHL